MSASCGQGRPIFVLVTMPYALWDFCPQFFSFCHKDVPRVDPTCQILGKILYTIQNVQPFTGPLYAPDLPNFALS